MQDGVLMVIAKEPLPGRAKTRLCPPCDAEQAAHLAACALQDTLEAVARTPARRRALVFQGDPERWCPAGFELIRQRGDGLDQRLAAAFADVGEPALLVGMDTPQLTPTLLTQGLQMLQDPDVDAVFGPSLDGGYWSVGLKGGAEKVFSGIPMSRTDTYSAQRARTRSLGLRVFEQPRLRDVDTITDAYAVALDAPHTRFAEAVAGL